ncbi:MAG: hypothetical protein GF417_03270 [Candidatus Latescibacteria bacterium]|nr:hypothetical protein [bacterium]MBD3423448.1 hypothetical protein [Candidatus Latescibacterota bacterium]
MKYNQNSDSCIKYLPVILAIIAMVAGCASNLMMEMRVDSYLPEEDYSGALAELESNERKFGGRNRLLFLFNRGALNFYSDNYAASAEDFLEAARVSEELFTKRISLEAAGLVNPNLKPYDGEDYEKVMIHVFAAFSYLKLGKMEDAGVEARKINERLELLSSRYQADNKYSTDAFARYLSGIIYEGMGESNNAYISYKLALEAYHAYGRMFRSSVPLQLKNDILRLAEELGFREQYQSFSDSFGIDYDREQESGAGEAVIVAMTGLAPFKREMETRFTHVDDEGKTHTFQILIPELVPRDGEITGVMAGYSGEEEGEMLEAEVVQDISMIARKNMSDKMPGIMVKAWLRALAKFKATEKAKKEMETGSKLGNLLIGSITDAVAEEITHADIRCWRTIPARIYMRRFRVQPGRYEFTVEMVNSGCPVERIVKENVEIREGQIRFVFAESFR